VVKLLYFIMKHLSNFTTTAAAVLTIFIRLVGVLAAPKESLASSNEYIANPEASSEEDRIVGGNEVVANSKPWHVAIMFKAFDPKTNEKLNSYNCGGTIITEKHILTAAHCLPPSSPPRAFLVLVAEHDITDNDEDNDQDGIKDDQIVQEHHVTSLYRHPNWNITAKNENDIAVMLLETNINLNEHAKVANLPCPNENLDIGDMLFVSGYGRTNNKRESDKLRGVYVPYVSNEQCKKYFGITDDMMCAGHVNANKGSGIACVGDSGGPLVKEHASGRTVVVGVVSWGPPACKLTGVPSVYSRVSANLDWLKDVLGNEYPDQDCSNSDSECKDIAGHDNCKGKNHLCYNKSVRDHCKKTCGICS